MMISGFLPRFALVLALLPIVGSVAVYSDPTSDGDAAAVCVPTDINSAIALLDSADADVKESVAEMLATPYAIAKKCFPQALRKSEKLEKDGCWYVKYDDYIDEQMLDDSPFLGDEIPANVEDACPNYATMGTKDPSVRKDRRRAFWHFTMQSMAGAESGFKAAKRMREKFRYTKDHEKVTPGYPGYDSLKPIDSDGLFQVSGGSNCGRLAKSIARSKLRKARENIHCAVGGLELQLFEKKRGMFTDQSQWAILQYKYNEGGMNSCLRKIPGYKKNDLAGIPEEFKNNVAGCRGLSGRRMLADFWEGYPREKVRNQAMGKNLCGRKHHFDFCVQDDGDPKGDGTFQCGKIPARGKRPTS